MGRKKLFAQLVTMFPHYQKNSIKSKKLNLHFVEKTQPLLLAENLKFQALKSLFLSGSGFFHWFILNIKLKGMRLQ